MSLPLSAPIPYHAASDERATAADSSTRLYSRLQFSGASDQTIGEAVRLALAQASRSLRTLDGVGVLVVPEVYPEGPPPRFRVTLQITSVPAELAGA